jgi:hypothetical protein
VGVGEFLQCLTGVGMVLAPLPGGQATKGADSPRQRGQSATMQTAPKFVPRLRRRGRHGQNTSGRWVGFFQAPVKIRPIRMSVCVGPLEMPLSPNMHVLTGHNWLHRVGMLHPIVTFVF